MDKTIRILHIIGGNYFGGKESLIMNVYKNINTDKIQFDFLMHSNEKKELYFHKEINKMGGRIYFTKTVSETGVLNYLKNIKDIIISNGPYHAVHSHMNHQSGLNALSAYSAGVKRRITHVHATDVGTSKNKLLLPLYRMIIKKYSTSNVACSIEAGKYFFSDKKGFKVINNGIEIDKFVYPDTAIRDNILKELRVKENIKVIGHVGRFTKVKNHEFLINIFNLLNRKEEYILVLVGDGPDQNKIEKMCKELNIEDSVKFLGARQDIHNIMSIFNIFLLPSFNEGLGTVLIEAQAAGVQCIASDTIPRDTDLGLNLIKYCSINSIDKWVDCIVDSNRFRNIKNTEIEKRLKDKAFDRETSMTEFLRLY